MQLRIVSRIALEQSDRANPCGYTLASTISAIVASGAIGCRSCPARAIGPRFDRGGSRARRPPTGTGAGGGESVPRSDQPAAMARSRAASALAEMLADKGGGAPHGVLPGQIVGETAHRAAAEIESAADPRIDHQPRVGAARLPARHRCLDAAAAVILLLLADEHQRR